MTLTFYHNKQIDSVLEIDNIYIYIYVVKVIQQVCKMFVHLIMQSIKCAEFYTKYDCKLKWLIVSTILKVTKGRKDTTQINKQQ